jgi:purine-nucleoside phosphorylase
VIASDCISADGTSRALDAGELVAASPDLLERLLSAGDGIATEGRAVSTDLFYDERDHADGWIAAGADVVEMETATLFALASRRGVEAASVLAVTDVVLPARVRIDADELALAEERMGRIAATAMGT